MHDFGPVICNEELLVYEIVVLWVLKKTESKGPQVAVTTGDL